MSIKTIPFQLRLPEGLHLGLKVEAARNRRSLQAEILQRLEESFVEPAEPVVVRTNVGGPRGTSPVAPGEYFKFKGPDPRSSKRS